ncbi:MAG: DUF5671 domain-containing protein [Patescibacteria group bacterium]
MSNENNIQRATPKDFFLNLLAIVTLYMSAASFLTIVFQIINISLPEIFEKSTMMYSGNTQALRFALASIIIVFPVYLAAMAYLFRINTKTPQKWRLGIRKWLIWFTLFAASLIIIGDLVALVNDLLSGETTLRFVLKALSILFVMASIFVYYLWDLRVHSDS